MLDATSLIQKFLKKDYPTIPEPSDILVLCMMK